MLERWGMGKYIDKHIHIYALYYTSIIASVIEPSSPPKQQEKGETHFMVSIVILTFF